MDTLIRGWHVEIVIMGEDHFFEIYDAEDSFIATFGSESDAERCCELWNTQED